MSRAAPLRRLLDSEKAARAFEMLRDGATYDQIAQATGYKHRSGVFRLIERHRTGLTGALAEEDRARRVSVDERQIDDMERTKASVRKLESHRDVSVRLRALATGALISEKIARVNESIARINGTLKAPPPIVQVNVSPTASYDISRLSIDDVRALAEIRRKMATPPELIEAKGHDVTEPTEPTQPEPKDDSNGTDDADDHDET